MDLLFQRYASPFLLFDGIIQAGEFHDFVVELLSLHSENTLFEIWLHKVQDKSFEEFKNSMLESAKARNVPKEQLATTIQNSQNILNSFIPT